jgi:hypothetical protein
MNACSVADKPAVLRHRPPGKPHARHFFIGRSNRQTRQILPK